jgi:RNA polymerase sigma-70 factor (ECF subfamily)
MIEIYDHAMECYMEDSKAIRLMKNNDITGLETLVLRYQVKAIRAAFLITQDEALAEDIVQETFIRVFQRIRNFDETRRFEPYLMRSIIHAALNAIRGKNKFYSIDGDISKIESLLIHATSVESEVEFAQLSSEILSALSRLSPKQRAVIVQRYYLDMSEQEMAQALNSPPGTIKWLLNVARAHLRELLASERSEE